MFSWFFFSPLCELAGGPEVGSAKSKSGPPGSPIPFYGQLYFSLCRLLTHATLHRSSSRARRSRLAVAACLGIAVRPCDDETRAERLAQARLGLREAAPARGFCRSSVKESALISLLQKLLQNPINNREILQELINNLFKPFHFSNRLSFSLRENKLFSRETFQ